MFCKSCGNRLGPEDAFCTHCGAPYYRRDSKDRQGNINSKWVCSGKINNGADSCPSFHI